MSASLVSPLAGGGPALVVLIALCAAYGYAWRRLRASGEAGATAGRLALFVCGALAVALAVAGPLDHIADGHLLSAHAVRVILLMAVAPPLLIAGCPPALLARIGRRFPRLVDLHPVAVFAIASVLLALAFLPPVMNAAVRDPLVGDLQHLALLASGLAFTWPLTGNPRSSHLGGLTAIFYLVAAELAVGVVGIYLAWYPEIAYDGYAGLEALFGLDPKQDQAVAGAILLVVAEPLVAIEGAVLFFRLLGDTGDDDEPAVAG